MCGICGFISQKEYPENVIREMNNTMIHRGPDDAGIHVKKLNNGSYLALGQRRLAIMDLSKAGHQPMFTKDGKLGIVFNGEIYNFKDLKEELVKKGYSFQSNCDTEVVLYLYKEYGIQCLQKLNGMFAICIADFEKEELLLVRDRMGKKPLYYYLPEDKSAFAFGSELKALMRFPEFHKEIRTELISAYLVNKSFASPNTVFRNTYKVEPGQYIMWRNGDIDSGWFWDILKQYEQCSEMQIESYEAAKKQLKHLLLDSIEKRMIADVPVGTFLSGGIDSSIVTAYASEVSEKAIQTFTIGFHTEEDNEAEYAKAVSQYLGTKHTELYITDKDLLEQTHNLVYYYDEPFSDSSQIPSMLVAELAKRDTTVILSGDGGDELFCGYEEYDWMWLSQRLDFLGEIGYCTCNLPLLRKREIIRKMPDKANAFFMNRNPAVKLQLFNDIREKHTREMVLGKSVSSKYAFEQEIHKIDSLADNWQMQRMLLDMRYYMADEVLVKMDRASMKYSLEVRCPILDHRIVEYSFRLPQTFKYKVGNKKRILKDLAYEEIPRKLLDRPKKGFGVPLVKWLRGEMYNQLLRYADETILKQQGIFEPKKVQELISQMLISDLSVYNSILWGFFVFQMWYQEYIEDLW